MKELETMHVANFCSVNQHVRCLDFCSSSGKNYCELFVMVENVQLLDDVYYEDARDFTYC